MPVSFVPSFNNRKHPSPLFFFLLLLLQFAAKLGQTRTYLLLNSQFLSVSAFGLVKHAIRIGNSETIWFQSLPFYYSHRYRQWCLRFSHWVVSIFMASTLRISTTIYPFSFYVQSKCVLFYSFRWAGESDPRVIFRNIVQRPRHKATGRSTFEEFTLSK